MFENEEFVDPIPGRPLHRFALIKGERRCCDARQDEHPYAFELYTQRVKYYQD